MSFLSPLFFVGLATIVVPVLVHLIQRERKRVIEFPSLMFLQKIPYQSVRRRRIRHWFLLLLRAAALALFVLAFARPFFPRRAAALAAAGGNREVVILLDHSASMGYGDRWQRAVSAARDVVGSIGAGDRATLVLFGRNAEETIRATPDRARLEAAISAARVTSDATRYGPALKLAESILTRSNLQRREAILISDFQRSGWTGAEDISFGDNMTVKPVSVASGTSDNVSVPSVTFARGEFSGQERITVTAGITNRSAQAADVPVTLEIEGRQLETVKTTVGANASASVSFAPFTLAEPAIRGNVKAGTDPLPADNTLYFVLAPSPAISVLVIDSGDGGDSSFYLAKALSIGTAPAFQAEVMPASRVTAAMLDKRSVVVLNNSPVPLSLPPDVLKRYIERGGGLLIAMGDRTVWPNSETNLMPGKLGAAIDRPGAHGATMGPDYSNRVFEIFKAPRSGDFSAVRILRYRTLEPAPTDRVMARYDDGAVAVAERVVGSGRVIAWTTSLDDSWTDLPRKPVFLPIVHQLVKYLARYEQPAAWQTAGQVVDLAATYKGRADRIVMTPAGERRTIAANDPGLIELTEQGVYEVRNASASAGRADRIAVNIDPAESDLSPLDPQELVAAVTGRAGPSQQNAPSEPAPLSAQDAERQQGLWWYLLVAGMLLLATETVIANRLSRNERFT